MAQATSTPAGESLWWDRARGALQSIGRSLMLPIAVLPAAALLLRLGQPDLLDIPWLAAAGQLERGRELGSGVTAVPSSIFRRISASTASIRPVATFLIG